MHIAPADFAEFLKKIDGGGISGRQGKDILRKAFSEKRGLVDIIEEDGHAQVQDRASIEKAVDEVLAANPAQAPNTAAARPRCWASWWAPS